MRQGLILPQISKRKPLDPSHPSQSKKDQLIRSFQHKLQIHQQQIQKNNLVIQTMTTNFDIIRSQLLKEKALNQQLAVNNKRIKDDLDRMVRSSRGSKGKLDELERLYAKQLESGEDMMKRIEGYREKENKEESDRTYEEKRNKKLQQENFNLSKINNQLIKEMDVVRGELKEKMEDQDGVRKEIEKYLQEMKELKEDRNRLKGECDRNEGKVGKISGDYEEKIGRLEEDNKKLRNQKKDTIQEKMKLQGVISQLRRQLGRVQISSDKALKQLLSTHKQIQSTYLSTIKSLTQQLILLKQSLQNTQQSHHLSLNQSKLKLQKLESLQKLSSKIDQGEKLLLDNLQCQFCKNMLKEPVTVIPCGHCFCLACKKGYQKECSCCGSKVKIEALYRNQLMDDVLAIYGVVKEIKGLVR